MANHNLPQTTSTYVNFVSELDGRFDDLSVGLDPAVTTATNIPTNSIRWNSALRYWEKYNGTTWSALSASFTININGSVGATTPSTGAFTTLSSSSTTALASGTTIGGNVAVTVSDTQTLTNKTLTSPVISTISNTGTITLPTSTDTLVGRATTDTLTNKTLTAPKFADLGFIADAAGNQMLTFDSVASAVNDLLISNAAAGNTPTVSAIGDDTNISLNIISKGTGTVQANGVAVTTISGTQTLTNKTLTTPVLSGTASGTTAGRLGYLSGELSYGNGTVQRTVVNTDEAQTLTNKTMSTSSVWNGNTIGVAYGGTGTTTAPIQGGIIYGSSTTAYASTAVGTALQILQSNGASAPTWATFDLSIHAPDSSFKKVVRVATTADLGASTFASDVLTGYDDTLSLNLTTTVDSATITTTSTAGIKVGATLSGNANIPAGRTVASIVNATTFTINSGTGVLAASAVATTFTQTIAALSIDGVAMVLNDRVLVKDQRSLGGLIATDAAKYNGIYTVSAIGSTTVPWTLTRSVDANIAADMDSAIVNVSLGSNNAGKSFKTYFSGNSTLNTTAMYWNRVVDANASSFISTPTTAVGINMAIPSSTTMAVAGAVADFVSNSLGIETIQATSASTYTRASTLYVAGAPIASTNVTITNPWSVYVASGNTYLGGNTAINGTLSIAGTTIATGTFNASATTPVGTTRLNYEGNFYPTSLNLVGTADTSTAATHYFVETGSDSFVRPKTLADAQAEIVTTATVSATTLTAGSTSTGALKYNGTTAAAGQLDGGTTTPTGTTRLNYGGAFYPTSLNLVGTADTSTAATHYFVETATDGVLRPKTLADVKTEIVTTTAVNSAAATTVGTITTGVWNATDIALGAGGTNASLTAVNGGVVYSGASAMAITAAGTSGQLLKSNGAAAPTWLSATNLNTASAVVVRDGSGNFSAGTITAALTGTASGNLALTGGTITTSGSTGSLIISDSGASGANIRLTGDGATTPSKTIRAQNGNFQIINNAYSANILNLTDAGNLTATGTITANSDERLKKDWVTLPSDFIKRLALVKSGTYTRIDSGERQAGSSAQDWQKLLPEVIITSDDTDKTLSLAYGNAALVSAIELAKEIEMLKEEIKILKGILCQ